MTRWRVTEAETGQRLDAWLARRPEIGSRSRATAWLERGKVFLNGAAVDYPDAGRRLQAGDEVGLWVDRPGTATPARRDLRAARDLLDVIREDEAILVADKPAGLLVEPLPGEAGAEPTLLDLVREHLRTPFGWRGPLPRQARSTRSPVTAHSVPLADRVRPLVVHRIDRDTSGLVLFAKTRDAQETLKDQFERREPARAYLAVVRGVVGPDAGTWRDRLVWDKARLVQRRAHPREARAKEALARYRVLEQFRDAALLEVSLVTGKRNQIRVQAGLRGHPIIGERLYRFGADPDEGPTLDRQALHAARLTFVHPVTGKPVRVSAPLPGDMQGLIARLKGGESG